MEIKNYILDKNGEAVGVEFENGEIAPMPYKHPRKLSDLNSREEFANDLNAGIAKYESERAETISINEPVPSMFANQGQYETAHKIWLQKETARQIREENKPPAPVPQPRQLNRFEKVLVQGTDKDRHVLRESMRFRIEADNAEKEAQYQFSNGQTNKAADLMDRARAFRRQAEKIEQSHEFSTQGEERTNALAFAKSAIEEFKKWTPEKIEKNRVHVQSVLDSYKDLSPQKETEFYAIDADKHLVKIDAGMPIREMEARLGTSENDKLVSYFGTSRSIERFEPPGMPKNRPLSLKELGKNPEKMTGRQFECWREGKGVIPAKNLDALNDASYKEFRATGQWPERMAPEGETVDGKFVYKEEVPTEDFSEGSFEGSLKPYKAEGEVNVG